MGRIWNNVKATLGFSVPAQPEPETVEAGPAVSQPAPVEEPSAGAGIELSAQAPMGPFDGLILNADRYTFGAPVYHLMIRPRPATNYGGILNAERYRWRTFKSGILNAERFGWLGPHTRVLNGARFSWKIE